MVETEDCGDPRGGGRPGLGTGAEEAGTEAAGAEAAAIGFGKQLPGPVLAGRPALG